MYSKLIPFKDFAGKPRNVTIHLNLTEPEFMKLLVEFRTIMTWHNSLIVNEDRELTTEEVVEFYTNLEKILLEAWGVPSEDGMHFRKAGRYDFEESALFPAVMTMFLSEPAEANKMLEEIMPKGLDEMFDKIEKNLEATANDPTTDADLRAQIQRLQQEKAALENQTSPTV